MKIKISILFVLGFLILSMNAQSQKISLKFSSATIYNSENKQVSGFDDGKEFIRTQDLTTSYSKMFLNKLNINGVLQGKELHLYVNPASTHYKFSLEEQTNEEYNFTGNLGDIVLRKDLLQLVIINRRVDKDGNEFIYMAVFGKPL